MLEQEFNTQLNESHSSSTSNPKKRKAKTPKSRSSATADSEDDEDEEYYGPGLLHGKKPKAQGIGYAGNKTEDVSVTASDVVVVTLIMLAIDVWSTTGASCTA